MRHWLKSFSFFVFKFWFVLILLGFIFWFAGDRVSAWIIRQPHPVTETSLQARSRLEVNIPVSLVLIEAEIDLEDRYSQVKVKTANLNLKKLEYEFPIVDFDQLQEAIARELGLPRQRIQSLIRYKIEY